MIIFKLICLL